MHSVVIWTQSPGSTAQSPGSTAQSPGSMAQSLGAAARGQRKHGAIARKYGAIAGKHGAIAGCSCQRKHGAIAGKHGAITCKHGAIAGKHGAIAGCNRQAGARFLLPGYVPDRIPTPLVTYYFCNRNSTVEIGPSFHCFLKNQKRIENNANLAKNRKNAWARKTS